MSARYTYLHTAPRQPGEKITLRNMDDVDFETGKEWMRVALNELQDARFISIHLDDGSTVELIKRNAD